jgi:hypothetical protein
LEETEGEPEDREETHDHHWEEVTHYPFEDEAEDEEDGTNEEEDSAENGEWLVGLTEKRWERFDIVRAAVGRACLRDGIAAIRASPAHQDHGEGHGGDDEAHEAKGGWVGISFDVIASSLDLGREIELSDNVQYDSNIEYAKACWQLCEMPSTFDEAARTFSNCSGVIVIADIVCVRFGLSLMIGSSTSEDRWCVWWWSVPFTSVAMLIRKEGSCWLNGKYRARKKIRIGSGKVMEYAQDKSTHRTRQSSTPTL